MALASARTTYYAVAITVTTITTAELKATNWVHAGHTGITNAAKTFVTGTTIALATYAITVNTKAAKNRTVTSALTADLGD